MLAFADVTVCHRLSDLYPYGTSSTFVSDIQPKLSLSAQIEDHYGTPTGQETGQADRGSAAVRASGSRGIFFASFHHHGNKLATR